MITIDELMTANPYTLSENNTLEDARVIMTEKNIRHIPVINDHKNLLGLVTQRDLLKATDSSTNKLKLSDIMLRDISTIHQSSSVRQAAIFLRSHKYGCLPVVSDNCLVGIITDSDFIDVAINLLEQIEITEDVDDDFDFEADSIDDFELSRLQDDF